MKVVRPSAERLADALEVLQASEIAVYGGTDWTAQELRDAAVDAFPRTDVLLMAAAVVDFRPSLASDRKLKKSEGQEQIHRSTPCRSHISSSPRT